jgi:hypothetical protein
VIGGRKSLRVYVPGANAPEACRRSIAIDAEDVGDAAAVGVTLAGGRGAGAHAATASAVTDGSNTARGRMTRC